MKQFAKTNGLTYSRNRTTQIYFKEIGESKVLTPDEEYAIALRAQKGDQHAVHDLVKANLRFVITVSKMYALKEEEQQEMIAAGNVGLIEAAQKFDPTRGFKFISYAVWHIRKEMILHIQKTRHLVVVPTSHLNLIRKAKEVHDFLFSKHGQEPSSMEVFEYLMKNTNTRSSLGYDHFLDVYQNQASYSSLDAPLKEGEESTLINVLDSREDYSSKNIEDEDKTKIMKSLFDLLMPNEHKILCLHLGIGHACSYTFREIAENMQVSTSAIEKVYRRSLRKLKKGVDDRKITYDVFSDL